MPVLLDSPNLDLDSDDEIVFGKKKKRQTCIKSDESDDDSRDRIALDDADHVKESAPRNLSSDEDILEREEEERISKEAFSSEPIRNFKDIFADKDLYDAESSDDEKDSRNKVKSTLQSLDTYDAEGSSDEASNPPAKQKTIKKKLENKSKRSSEVKKPKKSKEPKDEIDRIHSETQRIVRQSRVSLPYHKPRQRNIEEFLQRRPSVPAKSLRMSVDELQLLGKHVQKRVKEAEEFYKSSSDEDVPTQESAERKVAEQNKDSEEGNKEITTAVAIATTSDATTTATAITEPTKIDHLPLVSESKQTESAGSPAQNNAASSLFEGDLLAYKNRVEDILLGRVTATDQDSLLSKLDESGGGGNENEEETLDLVLNLEETETCDFLEKKKEDSVVDEKKVSETSVSEDHNSDVKNCDSGNVEKKSSSFRSLLNSADFDTQDLQLHFTEPETNYLLNADEKGSDIVHTKGSKNSTSPLPISSRLSSESEEKTVSCIPSKSLENSKTADKTDSLKLILRDDDASSALGEIVEGKQTVDIGGKSDIENPKIILEGEDAASTPLLEMQTVNSEDTSKVNQDDSDSVSEMPKLNDNSKHTDSHPYALSNIAGIEIVSEKKKSMSFLKDLEILKLVPPSLKIRNIVPQLKGSPSELVDLDDTPSPSGMKAFMQRFIRHSTLRTPKVEKTKVEVVSIITAEKGENGEHEVKKDSVTIVTENELETKARLQELKEELHNKIVRQKEEEQAKKPEELQEDDAEEKEEDEKSECGILDDEEEMEDYVTSSSSEEEEEEDLEEDDIEIKDKKKVKCAFVDDEAEEDEEEEDGDNGDVENVGHLSEKDEKEEKEEATDDDDDEEEEEEDVEDNDSKSETIPEASGTSESQAKKLKRIKTIDPFLSDDSSNEVSEFLESLTPGIPPYQLGGAVSQLSEAVEEEQFMPKIMAPTLPSQISVRKPLENHIHNSENLFSQPSQPPSLLAGLGIQASCGNEDMEDAELLDLCSGKFTSQLTSLPQDEDVDTDNLLQSAVPIEAADDEQSSSILPTISGQLPFPEDTQSQSLFKAKEKESKKESFLDVKEKEPKTQSFLKMEGKESKTLPVLKVKEKASKRLPFPKVSETDEDPLAKFGIRILGSSDEEDYVVEERPKKKRKKAHKKLNFSDEESDGNDGGEKFDSDLGEPLEVEYDSEENEIPVQPEEVKGFFEDEAELTESEWDSADEDEKGLDVIETEAGDDENIDQDQVKEQLGKIHMRHVLDDDQREVRRLQELLLEDGELHSDSGGRQRQFRWKNLNDVDDLNYVRQSDDEDGMDENEVEDEAEWRKKRFEREVFLQEQKEKEALEERVLIEEAIKLKLKRPTPIQPRIKVQQRGSFLARSEAALARIAQLARSTGDTNINGPTNSRNFVFATLTEEEKTESNNKQQAVKRKAPIQKEPLKKKICVAEGLLDKIIY